MRSYTQISRSAARVVAAVALASVAACQGFLEVSNPNVINSDEVDPVQDAQTLANSAQQTYQSALGWSIMYAGWFTGEALVSETFPTRNEYGRRDVTEANGSHNGEVWTPLSQALAGNHFVAELDLPNPDTNINYVRAHTWLGYGFTLMAETFCEGTVYGGPLLTTNDMLDSAIANFTVAITKGTANGTAAGLQLANVALVGRARANLQRGNTAGAIADATAVPNNFEFRFNFLDDPGNRTRLSNRMWQFTFDRGSISVAPAYQVSDPRVTYLLPGQHNLAAQDPNSGPFVVQQKYPAFTSTLRVASKLEADYILAEAQGTAAQLTHIAARRSANGRPVYAGPTDAASVLTEFMRQKHLDFYLEGQRFGDFRRNGAAVQNMPVPGSTYFKPGFAPVGNQTCYPLPLAERDNNDNIP
jgi:hypothetical protein